MKKCSIGSTLSQVHNLEFGHIPEKYFSSVISNLVQNGRVLPLDKIFGRSLIQSPERRPVFCLTPGLQSAGPFDF
jgi:hypothetical protein